jgi:hypothetical protein
MTVDDQIAEFETRLTAHLQYALFVNINLDYWEELNELDAVSVQIISDIVHDVFAPLLAKYSATPAAGPLERCHVLIEHALLASMNVPFPRDPILHVHRVIQNMRTIFIRTTYAQLRTEMIMANHHVHVIQRTWREANTNPDRLACRRRLKFEFDDVGAYSQALLGIEFNVLDPAESHHPDVRTGGADRRQVHTRRSRKARVDIFNPRVEIPV